MFRKQYPCVCLIFLALAVAARPVQAQSYKANASSVSYYVSQGNNPLTQSIYIYPSSGLNPAVHVTTANGGDWLSVITTTSGFFGEFYEVGFLVKSQTLAPGDYYGQVTLTQAGVAQFPMSFPVHLKVSVAGAYLSPAPGVINLSTAVGANPPSTTVMMRNVGSAISSTPSFAKTSSGGDWIILSAPMASTVSPDVGVIVSYNTANLAAGFYTGVITATAPDALDSPVNVPVNLNVGGVNQGPMLAVSPASLSFSAASGTNPPAQTIALNNAGQGTISPLIQTSTTDGAQWLNVLASQPVTGGAQTLTVSINLSGLANGNYTGSIFIQDSGSNNSPLTIPVTLTVQVATPQLTLRTNSVGFNVAPGSPKQTVTVDVSNTGTGALNFTTAVSTTSGGNWLSVSPSSGTTPSTLTITADPTGLAAGSVYQGQVTVSGTGTTQNIQVVLGVGVKLPTINTNGLVNGASFGSLTLSAGEIASAFGVDFGPATPASGSFVAGKLTSQVGGVTVTFDGTPAPLFYASNFQINAQVPFELAGKSSTVVQVTNQGIPGPTYTANLRAADPGVFMAGGRMTVFNQAGQQILPAQPAAARDVLTLWATGLGALSTAVATGAPGPNSPPVTTATQPVITIGGQPATILFAGYAPGFVGLYQVNLTVPAGLTSGDQPLIVSVGASQSAPQPLAVK